MVKKKIIFLFTDLERAVCVCMVVYVRECVRGFNTAPERAGVKVRTQLT